MSKIVVGEIEGPSTTSNKITIATGSQLDLVGSTGTTTLDGSDITAGTVARARLEAIGSTNLPSGSIVNSELFTYSTRTAFAIGTKPIYYWSVNYTKKLTDSILVVTCFVPSFGAYSGACGTLIQIDGTDYYSCFYNYGSYARYIDGIAQKRITSAGTKVIKLGYNWATSGTSEKPFNYWCPNASDDTRNQQTDSIIQVLEVVP